MRFAGRTALVTGGARGIGLAIGERLVAEGARVAIVDRDPVVETVAKRLGPSARAVVADVTRTADVDRAVDAAHAWTGVALGAFDGPTGTKIKFHIFVADKGDYYDIADGLPQNEH